MSTNRHVYVSPADVRRLVKVDSAVPDTYGLWLVRTDRWEIIKRFRSEDDRDAYLTRNHYI